MKNDAGGDHHHGESALFRNKRRSSFCLPQSRSIDRRGRTMPIEARGSPRPDKFRCVLLVVFGSAAILSSANTCPGPPEDLRVEYVPVPVLGVAVDRPRLSWSLPKVLHRRGIYQTSYRILLENAMSGSSIWDSGKVVTNKTLGIPIPVSLQSDSSYQFSVSWDDNDNCTSSKATGYFTTGLMKTSDWKGATWVTIHNDDDRNQFRTSLLIPSNSEVLRATCFVAGLGYQRSWLNGKRLGNANNTLGHVSQFQRRVPYETYDISGILQPGKNVLSVLLGRGWYALPEDNFTHVLGYRTIGQRALKVLCTAELKDGRKMHMRSGKGEWRFAAGELSFDHLFLGPTIDKRKATSGWRSKYYDDSKWDLVTSAEENIPTGRLTSFIMPPVQRHEPRLPVKITKINIQGSQHFVLDFEVNQAMQCTLRFASDGTDEGTILRLHHAEQIGANGDIVISNDLGGMQDQTTFILSNASGLQEFETRFAYFGARYVKISGWPANKQDPSRDAMTCYFVHTSLSRKSSIKFFSQDGTDTATILNGIHDITLRSALSNFVSTPTDCPSREKRGWTGDGQSAAETLIYSFDMSPVYSKWLGDIVDAQQCNYQVKQRTCPTNDPFCREKGDGSNIPEIAPFMFGGVLDGCANGSDPAWGSGFIAIYDWVYKYYGDVQTLEWHYGAAAAYMRYLLQFVDATPSGTCLLDLSYPTTRYGDWCAPLPYRDVMAKHTSNLINGFFWLKQLRIMAAASKKLGLTEDANLWIKLAKCGALSYNKLYFSKTKGLYRDIECKARLEGTKKFCHNTSTDGEMSVQTAQALPLFLDLPASALDKKRVGDALAFDVLSGTYPGRTTTGLVGTKYVLSELVKSGHAEVALTLATSMQYPSWGRMLPSTVHPLGQGEGTLWERWEGDKHTGFGSRNHIMLGGFDGPFFYGNLAGIQNDGGLAWSTVTIAPTVAGDLDGVKATVATVRGDIDVEWSVVRTKSVTFHINVSIPSGTKGVLKLPLVDKNATANDANAREGGTLFWKAGTGYKPGSVIGIDMAKPGSSLAGKYIQVDIRSGAYAFDIVVDRSD